MKKRVLALLMVLALGLGLVPAALADGAPAIELYMGEETDPFPRNKDNVVIAQCATDGSLRGLQLRAQGWRFSALNETVSNGRVTVSNGPVTEGTTGFLSVYCTAGDTTDPELFFRYSSDLHTIEFYGFDSPNGPPPGGLTYTTPMRILFTKPDQGGSGQNGDPSGAEAQLAGYVPMQPAVIPDAPDGAVIAPMPFTYEGETFYFGPAEDDALCNPLMGKGMEAKEGRSAVVRQCVGFWELESDGKTYRTVSSQRFAGLFEGLELSLQRGEYCNLDVPSVYYLGDDTDPAHPVDKTHMALLCTNDTPGHWVTVLTGRANEGVRSDHIAGDGSFTVYGMYSVSRTTVISAEHPEAELETKGLDAVTEFFAGCVDTYKPDDPTAVGRDPQEVLVFRYTLPYAANGYAGTILVPDVRSSRCTFEIVGERKANQCVTIRGGIVAGGARYVYDENGNRLNGGGQTHLYDLDFVGTGDLTDTTNVCGTGTGEIQANRCSFSGYYRAMECEGEQNWKLGFNDCTFRDNGVAIYMNATGFAEGNCRMSGNTFENNQIALWLAHFSPDCGMHVYDIRGCRFVENTCDVRNTSGRCFFMPRNLFIHGGVATNIVPCGLPGFDISPVSAYPYLTMDMRDAVYDVSYYGDDAIYISSDLEYQVPIFILTGSARYAVVSQAGDEDQFNGFWLFGSKA